MKKHLLAGLALALSTTLASALPTLQEVETQVQQGHYDRAETMMQEVVAARPGSARAHYIYAEVLAHDRKFAAAADEARLARQIDPSLAFTDAAKFTSFEQSLQREQQAARGRAGATTSGGGALAPTGQPQRPTQAQTPTRSAADAAPAASAGTTPSLAWGIGALVVALIAWRVFSNRRRAAAGGYGGATAMGGAGGAMGNPGAGVPPGGPYGPGAGYGNVNPNAGYGGGNPGMMGRPGGGLLGTGAAIAGGLAGGVLIDQMLHRRHDNDGNAATNAGSGLEPGSFDPSRDDVAANELENRPVDFGSGGDDWGSNDSSIDVGGGGGGGGGGGDDWG
jgi:hypothetical protein